MTDIILGMGDVGSNLFDLLSERGITCVGIDMNESKSRNYSSDSHIKNQEFLHICLPGKLEKFEQISLEKINNFKDLKAVIIHSTVKPGTSKNIQGSTNIPIFYSPVRGVHNRFLKDLKRYTKFIATDFKNVKEELKLEIKKRFKKIQWMTDTKTAELSKILVDTTYYAWLINYAQITKIICEKEGIDFDEMWKFSDEIHEFLGNRPKMFPGVIEGYCVIPNLDLINYDELDMIKRINDLFDAFTKKTNN